MSDYSEILVDAADRVLTITLNRPERLNAWTATMQAEVKAAIVAAAADDDIRCIIVTGAGRGFCAGADMDGLQAIEPGKADERPLAQTDGPAIAFKDAPGPDVSDHYSGRFGYMFACPKPIIAAINGPCAGIGLIFTLYADLRFAAEDAKFTTAFAERGLIAEHGISWLLPRLLGEARALDLLFTARKFLGREAEDLGLVNQALPGDQLIGHAAGVARRLAYDVSPRSVAVMKRQVRKAYFQSFDEALAIGDAEMAKSFATFDFKEGVQSFVERRAPAFQGR